MLRRTCDLIDTRDLRRQFRGPAVGLVAEGDARREGRDEAGLVAALRRRGEGRPELENIRQRERVTEPPVPLQRDDLTLLGLGFDAAGALAESRVEVSDEFNRINVELMSN